MDSAERTERWLNPIEKLWRWVCQDVLKVHRWVED